MKQWSKQQSQENTHLRDSMMNTQAKTRSVHKDTYQYFLWATKGRYTSTKNRLMNTEDAIGARTTQSLGIFTIVVDCTISREGGGRGAELLTKEIPSSRGEDEGIRPKPQGTSRRHDIGVYSQLMLKNSDNNTNIDEIRGTITQDSWGHTEENRCTVQCWNQKQQRVQICYITAENQALHKDNTLSSQKNDPGSKHDKNNDIVTMQIIEGEVHFWKRDRTIYIYNSNNRLQ